MFNKKLNIWIFLVVILTSCPVLADRGGVGNGGGPLEGPVENIPENFGIPGRGWQQHLPLRENDQRQDLQPLPEQIKRNYNQLQRERRQQFQQNWKRLKKLK